MNFDLITACVVGSFVILLLAAFGVISPMSWPADGEPRFVVASDPRSGGKVTEDLPAKGYVHDRARCFAVVYVSESTMESHARARASARAAELNAA